MSPKPVIERDPAEEENNPINRYRMGAFEPDKEQPFHVTPLIPRLISFIIDWLVLMLICAVVGNVMIQSGVSIGWRSRFIGFAIGVAYFGLLDSKLLGAATLGQRIAGIRIVGRDEKPLPLWRSLLRGSVLSLMIVSAGGLFPQSIAAINAFTALSMILAVYTIYAVLFDTNAQQTPFDRAASSYPVVAVTMGTMDRRPPDNQIIHIAIPAALSMVVLAIGFITGVPGGFYVDQGEWQDLRGEIMTIENVDGVKFGEDTRFDLVPGAQGPQSEEPVGPNNVLRVEVITALPCNNRDPACVEVLNTAAQAVQREVSPESGYTIIDVVVRNTVEFGWVGMGQQIESTRSVR